MATVSIEFIEEMRQILDAYEQSEKRRFKLLHKREKRSSNSKG